MVPILLMRQLGLEKLNDLPIITQLVIGRARVRIQICLILEHMFFILLSYICSFLGNITR